VKAPIREPTGRVRLWWAAAGLLVGLIGPLPARAGANIEGIRPTPDGRFIAGFVVARWDSRALPVAWRIHRDGVVNNTGSGGTAVGVAQAISILEQAFEQWNGVPGSAARAIFDRGCSLTGIDPAIECSEGKTSTATAGLDGENVFTWSDSSALGSGILARTLITTLEQDLVVGALTRDIDGDGQIDLSPAIYPDGITLVSGTIIDVDISYNSTAFDWVVTPADTGVLADILGVTLHEQGHWFGYAHSPLWGPIPVMFPIADTTSIERQNDSRTLKSDDMAAARRFYPLEPSYSSGFGAIRGRLVDGAGQPVSGEPVIALDASTLQAVNFGFTGHALTEYEAGAGAFAIEGLPPGDYFLQIGSQDASYIFLERNRFNYTLIYSTEVVHRPSLAVAAGQETATDDLLPPRRFRVPTLAAGGALDAGTLVVNSGAPALAPLGAAAPLQFDDNEAILIDFPAGFTFPFYGIAYRRMFVYDNGYVTLTNATSPAPDPIVIPVSGTSFADESLTAFLTNSPRIGALFRNHDPAIDNRGPSTGVIDVYYAAQTGKVSLTWATVPEVVLTPNLQDNSLRADTFTLSLYASGLIEMSYGSLGTPSGTVGITPGGSGVSFRRADFSSSALLQAGPLEAIVEEFWLGRPDFQAGRFRFERGLDLSAGLLRFVPGPDVSYAVIQPGLRPAEVSAPGASVPLRATGISPTDLTWDAAAPLFNLYRGLLSALRASGIYTPDGSCLAPGLAVPAHSDAATPPSEDGFYYLVSGESAAGAEGTLGSNGAGAERPNTNPCP
jgi:hypothetical protein